MLEVKRVVTLEGVQQGILAMVHVFFWVVATEISTGDN